MTMLENLFKPFVDWGIALKSKFFSDPFRTTRLQLMALYFLICIVIFVLLGWFVSSLAFQPVYQMFQVPSGSAAEAAYQHYQQQQFTRRMILIMLLVISTYFLGEFAMRPARKAAELQKHFIAVASHELRTPLAVMKNMAEVALRNPDTLTHEKAVGIIRSNLEETNRLAETVQFLLSSSLLRTQNQIPDSPPLVLSDHVERLLTMFENDITSQSIVLRKSLDPKSTIRGNRIALEALISNLLKNAIQHMPAGGTLTVVVGPDAHGRVKFEVGNTGTAIPRSDLGYLFEPFFRGRTAKGSGFGLGLSIARQSADLHKASIRVSSTAKSGTSFTVIFPTV